MGKVFLKLDSVDGYVAVSEDDYRKLKQTYPDLIGYEVCSKGHYSMRFARCSECAMEALAEFWQDAENIPDFRFN